MEFLTFWKIFVTSSILPAAGDIRMRIVSGISFFAPLEMIFSLIYACICLLERNGPLDGAEKTKMVRFDVRLHILHGSHSVFGYPNNRVSERCPIPIDSDKRSSIVQISEANI
ncbi:hypothetical protein TNCV_4243241 [Trichonephila clavipes]|nr:hypothetical protein TNCV_4243241 [Trichonephila clavipes]